MVAKLQYLGLEAQPLAAATSYPDTVARATADTHDDQLPVHERGWHSYGQVADAPVHWRMQQAWKKAEVAEGMRPA